MSSPRQKMVVVVPNELEQKKKKQPLERAKATHLSKQLQMRLQYAKLKVEHGWQRQNLNEVENLYFHHSHQRSMRQGGGQRPHYATVTCPGNTSMSAETSIHSSTVLDRTVGSSSLTNDNVHLSGSVSPLSQSSPEHPSNADGPSAHLKPHLPVQTSMQVVPPSMTSQPPSVLDMSDPNVLARLAQIQAQVQLPSQSQALAQTQVQNLSRNQSTTIPPSSSSSVSVSACQHPSIPITIPISAPSAFSTHFQFSQPPTNLPQPSFTLSSFASQPLGTPALSPAPIYPISTSAINTTQLSVPTSISTTASIPTSAPIPHAALTYDSFWSTHASSSGTTRALYRTHTGFTTSATPGGNVAMLTPGGNAAVMTAEGVYVGGSGK